MPTNSLNFNCSYNILKKSHKDGYQCLEAPKSSPLMFTIQPRSKRHCESRVEENDSGREIWFLLSACENRGSSPQAWEIQSSHLSKWRLAISRPEPLVWERPWPEQTGGTQCGWRWVLYTSYPLLTLMAADWKPGMTSQPPPEMDSGVWQ